MCTKQGFILPVTKRKEKKRTASPRGYRLLELRRRGSAPRNEKGINGAEGGPRKGLPLGLDMA